MDSFMKAMDTEQPNWEIDLACMQDLQSAVRGDLSKEGLKRSTAMRLLSVVRVAYRAGQKGEV